MGRFDNQFEVFISKGDKIITTYTNETTSTQPKIAPRRNLMPGEEPNAMIQGVVTQQPISPQAAPIVANAMRQGLVMDPEMINSTNQMYAGNTGTSVTIDTVRKDSVVQNVVAPYGVAPCTDQSQSNYVISQNQPTVPGKVVARPPVTPNREIISANGQRGITLTPEEFIALIEMCKASGKEVPISLIQAAPELASSMLQNQAEPEYTTPIKSVGPVNYFEHYYENGKRLFAYPPALKGQVNHWLNNMCQKFGVNIAVMLAEKLEIAFTPKDDQKPQDPPAPPPPPAPKVQPPTQAQPKTGFPRIMPGTNNRAQASKPKVITRATPQQVQSQVSGTMYPGIGHQMVQQAAVETVIAPRPEQRMLEVENPNTWKTVNNQPTNTVAQPMPNQPQVQTSNLFPIKPMTREEKEAADAKASNETAITGFPGVAMVDSLRFKTEVPKIRKAVEARFGEFPLSVEDADRQVAEMATKIEDFVANDIAAVMGTDTNGIEVSVVRTTDHRNNDCFKVDVSNYKSPVFMTVLYPSNEQVDEAIAQDMQKAAEPAPIQQEPVEEEMQIPQQELEEFFTTNFQAFDASNCRTAKEVKSELTAFLVSKLLDTYNSDGQQRITVPRAYKEATAYVEQAVEIKEKPATPQQQQQNQVVPPQPAPKMVAGSAGASL